MNAETALKKQILAALATLGVTAWNSPAGLARRGRIHMAPTGTPDIIGYLPGGRMLALEVKLLGKKLRPEQAEWIEKATRAGVASAVVRSAEDALRFVATAEAR